MGSAISNRVPLLRRGTTDIVWCAVLSGVLLFLAWHYVLAGVDMVMLVAVAVALRVTGRGEMGPKAGSQNAGVRDGSLGQLHESLLDGLTGIASRVALDARVEKEWQRERRPLEPTSLVLIGVDDFDRLQQAGGKLAVDLVMLTLARALRQMLPRGSDLLSRHGVSTFAVMLPGTDLPGALRVAARLRWTIVRLGIVRPEISSSSTEPAFVTTSMGVAVQHEAAGEGALVAAAEGALRAAGRSGCDSLEFATVEGAQGMAGGGIGRATLPTIRAGISGRELAV